MAMIERPTETYYERLREELDQALAERDAAYALMAHAVRHIGTGRHEGALWILLIPAVRCRVSLDELGDLDGGST